MANENTRSFYIKDNEYDIRVVFDLDGYVVKAKGFKWLMWTTDDFTDESLVGKHIDELAEILKKYPANREVYINFELCVHIPMLKTMLSQKQNKKE